MRILIRVSEWKVQPNEHSRNRYQSRTGLSEVIATPFSHYRCVDYSVFLLLLPSLRRSLRHTIRGRRTSLNASKVGQMSIISAPMVSDGTIFSRIVHGTRISLKVGLIAMTFSIGFGTLFGAISGYYGGRLDNLIMRVMDIMLAMPSILLAMVIVTILGQNLTNAIIAVSIVYIPQYARILRAAVLKVRELDYVVAAKVIGASDNRILLTTVLPNCIAPLIVQATLGIGGSDFGCSGTQFFRTRCGGR